MGYQTELIGSNQQNECVSVWVNKKNERSVNIWSIIYIMLLKSNKIQFDGKYFEDFIVMRVDSSSNFISQSIESFR